MDIAYSRDGDRGTLALAGEFTIYAAAESKGLLLAPLAEVQALAVDLAGVTEMDTTGIQLLILAKREAQTAGKTLSLAGHSPAVVELMELYGLAAWFGDPLVLPAETQGEPA